MKISKYLHKYLDEELLRPSIFGMFDGLTSLLGVIIPLLSQIHILIFVTCFGLAVSSAISMGLGEFLSSDSDLPKKLRIKSAIYMGIFTGVGCFLPVLPYLFIGGLTALALSILIYLMLTFAVAAMKSTELGWKKAIQQTLFVSLLAIVIVVGATIGLPTNGG